MNGEFKENIRKDYKATNKYYKLSSSLPFNH